eukprot:357902-Chlamydomonas_euryale.AAC.8
MRGRVATPNALSLLSQRTSRQWLRQLRSTAGAGAAEHSHGAVRCCAARVLARAAERPRSAEGTNRLRRRQCRSTGCWTGSAYTDGERRRGYVGSDGGRLVGRDLSSQSNTPPLSVAACCAICDLLPEVAAGSGASTPAPKGWSVAASTWAREGSWQLDTRRPRPSLQGRRTGSDTGEDTYSVQARGD